MRCCAIHFVFAVFCGFFGVLSPDGRSIADAQQSKSDEATSSSTAISIEAPTPKYQLRYRFKPNQLVYYDVVHKSTVFIKTEGSSETTKNKSSSRKHFRVVSVEADGSGLLELSIDRVRMSVQFGDNDPSTFDSQSDDPVPQPFVQVKQSIGVPQARIKVALNGRLFKAQRLHQAASGAGQLRGITKTADDDPSHNFLVVFPEQEIGLGESWSERLVVRVRVNKSLLRPVTLLKKYELVSVEQNLATIRLKMSVLTPIRDTGIRAQLIQRTPSGTIVFDLKQGLIVSKTLSIDKREVGLFNEKSLMHAKSQRSEKLVNPATVAAKPAAPIGKRAATEKQ